MSRQISLLIRYEGSNAVVQCLEYDIAAQGNSIREALESWAVVFSARILIDCEATNVPLSNIPPAPSFYFEEFRSAFRLVGPPLRLSDNVPSSWMATVFGAEIRIA